MNLYKLIFYLSFLLLNYSCATFKENKIIENKIDLNNKNLKLINGTYKINKNQKPYYLDYFWGAFYTMKEWKAVYNMKLKKAPSYFITLKAVNENTIYATLKVNNNFLKSYIIRGKIKNGYFEQNRQYYFIPALIFNEFYSYKFRIGLLKNYDLITDCKKIDFGTVYFFSSFNNSAYDYNVRHCKVLVKSSL